MNRMNIFECVVKICQAIMTGKITKTLNNNRFFRNKDLSLSIAKNESIRETNHEKMKIFLIYLEKIITKLASHIWRLKS